MASKDKSKKPEEKEKKIRFKRTKNFYHTNKKLFWTILIIATILLFFLGTKIALFINLMLGNDIIITLTTEKQNYHLKNGETENITFLAKVKTNPFCKASCDAKYEDVSKGVAIKTDTFLLSPQKPLKMNYVLKADMLGQGQKLYRETLVCRSVETAFCHTLGDNTSRSILITLNYELNNEEIELKNSLYINLEKSKTDLETIYAFTNSTKETIKNISGIREIDSLNIENQKIISEAKASELEIFELRNLWENQDYKTLNSKSVTFKNISSLRNRSENIYLVSNMTIMRMINATDEYVSLYNKNVELSNSKIEDDSLVLQIKNNLQTYITFKNEFEKAKSIDSQEIANLKAKEITEKTEKLVIDQSLIELNLRKTELINVYTMLCKLDYSCVDTSSFDQIQTLTSICNEIEKINPLFIQINNTFDGTNLSSINDSVKNDLVNLKKEVSSKGKNANISIQNKNLALFEFVQTPIDECNIKNIDISLGQKKNFPKTTITDFANISLNLSFDEQEKTCCIKGKCEKCCEKESCGDKDYPLLFLHGHSFNKRLETEYSLDAFNKIQDSLEKKGYINSGAISLYSPQDEESGVWEHIPAPLSIKVSYYYDIFKTQQDYVLIQTKSENIDTYALRLNDLINSIIQKTGKKKVTIVAHSMGGLVTRRYIQIFGSEKIDKFIMIATPNAGVTGAIADYCSLVGEKQECIDLRSDSLFLNKLNRDQKDLGIKTYVLYGTGCDTSGKDGDGIVTSDSAKLEYAQNIEIKGNCTGVNTLHTDLLDITKYPQVYREISKILE